MGESGGEVVPTSASRVRLLEVRVWARMGAGGVSAVEMRGGASVDAEGEVLGEDEAICGRVAALTGLRMQRFT